MTDQIRTGTAQGLIEFVDYLMRTGYAPPATGSNWKGAAKNVLLTVEQTEEYGSVDVNQLTLDDYLTRFDTLARGKMKQDSITAYSKRFRKVVEEYRSFLNDANWKPPSFKPAASQGRRKKAEATPAAEKQVAGTDGGSNGHDRAAMIDYPFPLRGGQIANVRLPAQIEREDADRLSGFLHTLVIERRPELPPGEEREAA